MDRTEELSQHRCLICGAQLRPGARFCTACGAPLASDAQNGHLKETLFPSSKVTTKGDSKVVRASVAILIMFVVIGSLVLISERINSPQNQAGTSSQGVVPQSNTGPSPQLRQALNFIENNTDRYVMYTPDPNYYLYDPDALDPKTLEPTDKGLANDADILGRVLMVAITTGTYIKPGQSIDPNNIPSPGAPGMGRLDIEQNLQKIGLPLDVDQALVWAQAYQKDPQNWWRHS